MKRLAVIASLLCWLAVGLAGCSTVDGWVEDAHDSLDSRIAIEEARISGGSDSPVVVDNDSVDGTPDDIDLSSAKWYGPSGAGAKVIGPITNLRIDSHNFHYSQPPRCKEWTYWRTNNGKDVNSYACFMVKRGGQFAGGRFDDCSWSRNSRERKNILGGYTGGIIPANGEDVWFFLMNKDCTERTTAEKVSW